MSTADATTDAPEEGGDNIADIKKVMYDTKTKGGKSVWAMTKETFGMADGGKSQSTDRMAASVEEGVTILKGLISEAKEKETTEELKKKWDLPYTPFAPFEASYDDALVAFIKWARKIKGDEDDGDGEADVKINVHKAFRRFQTYAAWMHDNQDTISKPELTSGTLTEVEASFPMRINHDESGHLLWWLDFTKIELEKFSSKEIPVHDVVRYMTMLCHLAMFDERAQDNGLIFIEDCAKMGFYKMMTAFPMEVGAQMDRLTIGCLPIKLKAIYVMNAATWMNVMMALMKPFMSKKMRKRVIVIGKKEKPQDVIGKAIGGSQYIPANFCSLEGSVETDLVKKLFE